MVRNIGRSISALALVFALFPNTCQAISLLVGRGAGTNTNNAHAYYGGSSYQEISAIIDSTFDTITVAPDLTKLSQLLAHDRLWVDSRSFWGPDLTPVEIANIQAFAATGRRVVMLGDRGASWSEGVLSVVGGRWGGEGRGIGAENFAIQTGAALDLTYGVDRIDFSQNSHGVAIGGTPLFEPNWSTLWGDDKNVLTVLDINTFDHWFYPTSAQYARNVVAWLAVPEPSTLGMLVPFFFAGAFPSTRRRRSRPWRRYAGSP